MPPKLMKRNIVGLACFCEGRCRNIADDGLDTQMNQSDAADFLQADIPSSGSLRKIQLFRCIGQHTFFTLPFMTTNSSRCFEGIFSR